MPPQQADKPTDAQLRRLPRVQLIGCGALVRELRAVLPNDIGLATSYLPAPLHNRPDHIVPAIEGALAELPASIEHVLIGYGDCGTGGGLDTAMERWRATHAASFARLPGDHCYEFFTGASSADGSGPFAELHGAELGTLFVTDYLARHFELLIWQGLGLDEHPELLPMYFGNYTRLVHLSQTDDPETLAPLDTAARSAAERLGLRHERVATGLEPFARAVEVALVRTPSPQHRDHRTPDPSTAGVG